ncbi:MAG TPA: FG-GAP repeat protein [Telluria sp.]
MTRPAQLCSSFTGKNMRDFRHSCRLLAMTIAALSTTATAQAATPDLLSQEMCKTALPQATAAFAGVLAPIQRKGHCIAGDFNGDGKPDVVMVVKVLSAKLPTIAGLKTIHPFHHEGIGAGRLQFLALHSTAGAAMGDWMRYDKLLLDGGSPILVLRAEKMDSDMVRVTQRARIVKDLEVPRAEMRGEAISLGTEAVEAVLYWNGKTYVFHEDPAGP